MPAEGERRCRGTELARPQNKLNRETMLAWHDPEQLLATAMEALATNPRCPSGLDEIPVPVYTTDAQGAVTYCNPACTEFAGREPALGQDRWSINLSLFTTSGLPLRREDCPMAVAIKTKQPIRDAIAVAERPDGSRVAFRPYPTPLFDEGEMIGAINMLIDVTAEQCDALRQQAERCRRLADATYDRETRRVLTEMAERFNSAASELTAKQR